MSVGVLEGKNLDDVYAYLQWTVNDLYLVSILRLCLILDYGTSAG